MEQIEHTKCDKCHATASVIAKKPVSEARGKGVLALIDCPLCGKREQWIVQLGDADDLSG